MSRFTKTFKVVNGRYFAYGTRAERPEIDWAPGWMPGYPDMVLTGHDFDSKPVYRFAKVLKTVAYVVVDEDAEGRAVAEKWKIRHCSTAGILPA